ncbi:uncharacterized protein LOC133176069 [Saccostrea echinata]|uniref:uncharacterized protein LOC133176069 n=1 Tax=Saccostrea echinata TaxID=191078 RepID=UPI002A7F7521|nr:uncharacterized protein LOC133176069 [Saccostrea echinata]
MRTDVEEGPFKGQLNSSRTKWIFYAPNSSHMGGVWERMIDIARRILDALFLKQGNIITHEVLVTLMAEVCAIINSKPISAISQDSDAPKILSASLLLTQRIADIKDIYIAQWRHVQILRNTFWEQWREEFLQNHQTRQKWTEERPNIKIGDVVLLKDSGLARFQWPVGIVESVFPSDPDDLVRKVRICIIRDGKPVVLTRLITEMVLLIN